MALYWPGSSHNYQITMASPLHSLHIVTIIHTLLIILQPAIIHILNT